MKVSLGMSAGLKRVPGELDKVSVAPEKVPGVLEEVLVVVKEVLHRRLN